MLNPILLGLCLVLPTIRSDPTSSTLNTTSSAQFPLKYRGFMLDVARKFFPVRTVKYLIDAMYAAKMNVLHLHLTDDEGFNVEWSYDNGKLTKAANNGGFYSAQDLAEIVSYAGSKGITVIPELDMPAHAGAWNKSYPELMVDWTYNEFNMSNPKVFPMLKNLLLEICPKFSSEFVHVGHDEMSMPPSDVQKSLDFAEQTVLSMGRRPIIWNDPITGKNLRPSKNYTIQVWTNSQALDTVLAANYSVIVSVSDYWYIGSGQTPWTFVFPKNDNIIGAELAWWTGPSQGPDPEDMVWVTWRIHAAGNVMYYGHL